MKTLYIITLLLISTLSLHSQIYSFESESDLSGFKTVDGGRVSITTEKYKLGKQSLRWDWVKGSSLIIDEPGNLDIASRSSSGGLNLFIYNSKNNTTPLVFKFLSQEGDIKCEKEFNLGFEGWRSFWCAFSDMGHKRSHLSGMQIEAPKDGESGTIYLDFLQFVKAVQWSRMSDAQYCVNQSSQQEKFWENYQKNISHKGDAPSKQEIEELHKIEQRVEQWFLGTGDFERNTLLRNRRESIETWIKRSKKGYPELTVSETGIVTGPGLFPMTYPVKVENESPQMFRDFSTSLMLPLAFDIRMNNSNESVDKLMNLYDWFNDQGWAAGSALGTLYMEKLRSSGYFNSLFLVRNQLGEARLKRELETLKWYSLFGSAIERENDGETADNFRSLLMPKLYYVLMIQDETERVYAMREFVSYCQKAFKPVEGFIGTFKPDYMGYHHQGTYLGAYYPTALYSASWIAYLLRDTSFEMPKETLDFMKQATLSYRNFCGIYDAPTAANGRFPNATPVMHKVMFGIPYLSEAMGNDAELESMIARLWNDKEPLIKEYIETASAGITFTSTIGEIEAMLTTLSRKATAEKLVAFSGFYPYGGLGAYRGQDYLLTTKGASKYIWDFEGGGKSENTLGRYLSNGMIEITDLKSGRKNPCVPVAKDSQLEKIFDWNRLTGTTAIELSNDELHYQKGGGNKHRNFTDQIFLGGVNLDSEYALSGMSYHDITYDNSFEFKKTILRIGDAYICLASTIKNNNKNQSTITTLFQNEIKDYESITVNNKNVTANTFKLKQPILTDNMGTTYIVMNGEVDLDFRSAKDRKITSAVINHGTSPKNESYAYILLPKATKENQKLWKSNKNGLNILQQDEAAHIINHSNSGLTAVNIFDESSELQHSLIKQVNTPSLILYREKNKKEIDFVISDPDMRRTSAQGISGLNEEIKKEKSSSFVYQVELKGEFKTINLPEGFTLSTNSGITKITGEVREGRSYNISLSK